MDVIFQLLSPALIIAVLVQVLCQIYKVVFYSVKERKLAWHYLFSAGGMPSAHSAFVTSLSISIGLLRGFNSELFALAFVFSAIIIHDSFNVRGTVQIHSRILQKLTLLLPAAEQEYIPGRVGHTIPEIIVGVIAGIVITPIIYLLLIKPFIH